MGYQAKPYSLSFLSTENLVATLKFLYIKIKKTSYEKMGTKYSDRKDIQLVGIHTVFEGHSQQTPKRLRQYVKEKNITYPVGVDDYVSSQRMPETMIRYNNSGTPEIAIIDKKGEIRFQHLGSFKPEVVEKLVNTLLNKK